MAQIKHDNDGVLMVFLESDGQTDRVIRFCEVITRDLVIRIRPSRTVGLFDVFNAQFAPTLLQAICRRNPSDYVVRLSDFDFEAEYVGLGALTVLHNSRRDSDHEIVTIEIKHGSAAKLFVAAILDGFDGDVLEFRERAHEDAPFVDRALRARENVFQEVRGYVSDAGRRSARVPPAVDATLQGYTHLMGGGGQRLN